jgi:adenylate kinase family enzyme
MRILVTGASGSGTSTLGRALAHELDWAYFDIDDYFWLPTKPPFTQKRDRVLRLSLLLEGLQKASTAVLGGSIVDWGVELENSFALIVFLTVPKAIRIERLRAREIAQLGHADPAFLEWAAQYDEGGMEIRSLAVHERWLSARSCPILRIDGDTSVNERVAQALKALPNPTVERDALKTACATHRER